MADPEVLAAINSLRRGAWTEAAMLGTGEAAEAVAERYRTLVRVIDHAGRADEPLSDPILRVGR